ncbi:PAS domain S-box-containing protein [Streptomyces sp. yr375]|uniref:SpoIIE family protein phosphatase n=1 Tax=Streptomyces sp. yr375 TaxID=1761906 RepID=UPI0008B437D5|nr:SpoIIE family protein phosphatase [Streptomyces sp. yr375]SER03663.1 PAS domain S-box-containing protein [Streptomyces sp. yr375]
MEHATTTTPDPTHHTDYTDYTASAVIDERGVVTGWTEEAQRFLGFPAAEIVGRSAAVLLADPLPEATPRSFADLPRWHGTVRLRHRDGSCLETRLLVHRRAFDGLGQGEWLIVAPVLSEADSPYSGEPLMERAFAEGPCAAAIYDSDRRLRRANADMEAALGLAQEDMRGLRVSEIILHPHIEETDKAIREVLATGEPQHRENFLPTPGRSRQQAWAVSIVPLRGRDGRVNAVCLAAHDESRQYWARQRLQLLNEASASIGSTLDVVRTAQELADVATRGLADFVSVDMLRLRENGDNGETDGAPTAPVRTERAEPVALRHIAKAAVTESCPEIPFAVGDVETCPEDSPQAECLATGRTVSRTVTAPDTPDAQDAQDAQDGAGERLGFHVMAVPMQARGVTLGVAVFGRRRFQEAFDPDDLLLAEEITARAAVCIDNARRYTRERSTALTLQRSLLPRRMPRQAAVEVASRYLPAGAQAGVGGDWFDVIPLSGARVALVVGDVVGHGIQASATMGRLRTAVRTLADVDLPPDELLTHLDDLVTHLADDVYDAGPDAGAVAAEATTGDVGATCLYAVYDPVSRRCTLARAGHPLPFTVTPEGTAELLGLPAGPPLGLGGLPFESAEVELPEGSLLVLYTDGLVEARGRDIDEGLDILRRALTRPAQSLDEVCDAALKALLTDRPEDDVALLIARPKALDAGQVATWDIPADPASVAGARKSISAQLDAWGLEETVFTTELVVSELVTNAIRYGEPPIQLRLIHDRTLICEVSDASNTAPHLRRARLFDEGGRGLLLVAQLTQGWGTRQSTNGKTIWAEQTLPVL